MLLVNTLTFRLTALVINLIIYYPDVLHFTITGLQNALILNAFV